MVRFCGKFIVNFLMEIAPLALYQRIHPNEPAPWHRYTLRWLSFVGNQDNAISTGKSLCFMLAMFHFSLLSVSPPILTGTHFISDIGSIPCDQAIGQLSFCQPGPLIYRFCLFCLSPQLLIYRRPRIFLEDTILLRWSIRPIV